MRHILAPGAVATCPRGVREPSAVAGLVAPSRVAQGAAAGTRGAVTGTIDLATIATATDQRLGPASRAHEHPRGCHLALVGPASMRWTNATIDWMMAPHACPARVWGTASSVTAKFRSAPCLPLDTGKPLSRHQPPRQPAIIATLRHRTNHSSKPKPNTDRRRRRQTAVCS